MMSRSHSAPIHLTALLSGALLSAVVAISESTAAVAAGLVLLALLLLAIEAPALAADVEDDLE